MNKNKFFHRSFTLFKIMIAFAAGAIAVTNLDADIFDHTFGTDGLAILDENVQDGFEQFAVAPDGSVFVVGRTYANHVQKWNVIIAKFTPNGILDPTFGGDGEVELHLGDDDVPRGIALQDDGKVVVLSRAGNYSYLSRYHTYGAPDYSINQVSTSHYINVEVLTPNPPGDGPFGFPGFWVQGMTQRDNQFVVYSDGGAVAVFNENGFIDDSFGYQGMVWTSLSFSAGLKINDILVSNDKIYLFGKAYENGAPTHPSIYALNSDGSPDLNFGDGGIVRLPNGVLDKTTAFVYNDGLFTMAGGSRIVRMDENGILAGNLSIDGIVQLPENNEATDVVLQPYGRIAVSVKIPNDDNGQESNNFAIVRLLADGVPDHDFAFATFGLAADGWFQMAYEEVATAKQLFSYANGKILAGGDFKKITGNESVLLLRLGSSNGGSVDDVFRGSGGLTTGGFSHR